MTCEEFANNLTNIGHDVKCVDGELIVTLHKHCDECDEINAEAKDIGKYLSANNFDGCITWEVEEYDG